MCFHKIWTSFTRRELKKTQQLFRCVPNIFGGEKQQLSLFFNFINNFAYFGGTPLYVCASNAPGDWEQFII